MERIIQFQQYESGVDYMKTYKMVNLGEIITPAKIVKCGDGEYPVLSMTMHNGLVFQDDKFKKEIASSDKSNYKVVYKNQLVISFPIDEGVLAAQRITDAGIVSPAYGIWDIDQSRIRPEYLEMALRSERALQYYKANLRGSTARRRSLPTPTLLAFEVPLPSIEEQEKVLETIHIAEKMVELYNNESEQLDNLIKARFVELFGLPVSNTKGWKTEQMGEVAPAINYKGEFDDEVWLLNLDMVEAQTGRILDYLVVSEEEVGNSTCTFDTSNVLYSKLRPYLNKVVIPDRCGYATSELVPLQPVKTKINREYLAFMLRSDEFVNMINEKVAGAKMPRVPMGDFRKFDVPVPPMELQEQFADFAHQVNKSKVVVQKGLSESMIMLSSLRQDYFG